MTSSRCLCIVILLSVDHTQVTLVHESTGAQQEYLGSALEAYLEAVKTSDLEDAAEEATEVGDAMLQLARLCHLIVQVSTRCLCFQRQQGILCIQDDQPCV